MSASTYPARRFVFLLSTVLVLATACSDAEGEGSAGAQAANQSTDASESIPAIHLSPAFPKLSFIRPVFLTHPGDGTRRLFVVEQYGRIRVLENRSDAATAEVFLDIRPKVFAQHNEEGLLALAFHPQFKENRQLFVYYTADKPRRGVLSRFTVAESDPSRADPESEKVLLEVEQPWGNHNGCMLAFGPDGYLYMSLGDGGWRDDPQNNGQDLSTLLGSIIRIDVDREEDGRAYAVPDDNPFVNQDHARGEIWAYGLRNVWRMSFDRETGQLWAGDVGQDQWEEIDLIVKGGNYGWRLKEGTHPYIAAGASASLIDPVAEYSHREGLSVTGGYVYRGKSNEKLRGVYLYGDYVTGRVWGLRSQDGKLTGPREILTARDRPFIASFGEDADGELYVVAFDRLDRRGSRGRLYRIVED